MASSWMENPTDKDGLLLKHQIKSAVFNVRITTSVLCAFNLTSIACGRWSLVIDPVKYPGALLEQLSCWRNDNWLPPKGVLKPTFV